MKYILLTYLLGISLAGLGQGKQYIYYFDKDLNTASQPDAVFKGIGVMKDNRLQLNIYNVTTDALVITQYFTDTTLQVSDGLFQSFFADGQPELAGNYLNGNADGLWQKADSVGHIIDSSFYERGEVVKYIHRGYDKSGYPDSIIVNDSRKDELSKIYFEDSGRVNNEVSFTAEKGMQKFYAKGVFSHADSVFTRDEIEASFPGGAMAWTQYVSRQLGKHLDEIDKYKMYGSCTVKFIVDKEGKVTAVEATTMRGTRLAALSEQIIKNSPRWTPAVQYGRKVNAYRIQPVTLMPPDN